MMLEVMHQHEKLAPESGIEFMAMVSGASFWSMCQRPYTVTVERILQQFLLFRPLKILQQNRETVS